MLIYGWTIPIRTISEANACEYWRRKYERHQAQKRATRASLQASSAKIALPCKIKLTRVSPRFLDSDNLPVSMKYIRDEIADFLIPGKKPGFADNDPRLSWEYAQTKGNAYAVHVDIYIYVEE